MTKRPLKQGLMLPFVMRNDPEPRAPEPPEPPEPRAPAKRPRAATVSAPTLGRHGAMQACFKMPLSALSGRALELHVRDLTLTPIDPYARDAATVEAYRRTATHLLVPRFYGLQHWGAPGADGTREGLPMDCSFEGALQPRQVRARDAVLAAFAAAGPFPRGGMLVLPCGWGKTVVSLAIAAASRRRTLVLVHKTFLLDQWRERASTFVPHARIGTIRQGTVDADADIVIGMIQSIATREYGAEVFAQFGLVIADEAHHMAAPVFHRALHKLPARLMLALSATPQRRDGMTDLLHWSMGPVLFRAEREHEHVDVLALVYDNTANHREINRRDGKPMLPLMLNHICQDAARNLLVAGHIAHLLGRGRKVIVLSDRISQLEALRGLLRGDGVDDDDMTFYIGKSSKEVRERAPSKRCLLSTYSMSREALDIPALDTLVMASPTGDVVQALGRILRSHPDKKTPQLVDVIDPYSLFDSMRWKRNRYYREQGFNCRTLHASSGAPLDYG